MYIEGLDELDNKIVQELVENARASYSEIGEKVGLTRVAVRNRMDRLEKVGVIKGYKAVIDSKSIPEGVEFVIDIEAEPEHFGKVADTMAKSTYVRRMTTLTGSPVLHLTGFAPSEKALGNYCDTLFRRLKGIKKIDFHVVLNVLKDADGGIEYKTEDKNAEQLQD